MTFIQTRDNLYQKSLAFFKDNGNLHAISMGSKMLAVTALFAVLPISTAGTTQSKPYNTNLKLDAKKPFSMVSTQNKTSIEIGDSEFLKQEKENSAARTKVATKAPAQTQTQTAAHNDPNDFRILYMAAGKQFGIPWQLIEAVHQVESGKSGSTAKRSGAGAQGPMQFMPGTWRAYGIDGNGDGVTDATDVTDAIYGAANLLAKSGAAEGDIDGALFNYNHAMWYVTKVKTIAYEIGM